MHYRLSTRNLSAGSICRFTRLHSSLRRVTSMDLQDGDTLVFLGDSITHQCLYTQYVEDYYYTRYPDRRIRFYNAGVSGDKAGDALARFEGDVADWKPKYVTILLGMNDGTYRHFDRETFRSLRNRHGRGARSHPRHRRDRRCDGSQHVRRARFRGTKPPRWVARQAGTRPGSDGLLRGRTGLLRRVGSRSGHASRAGLRRYAEHDGTAVAAAASRRIRTSR